MNFVQPILADITHLIFGLVALIILILRQLFEANKQAAPPKPRLPAVPPPQPVNKGAAPVGGQQADALRAQVEEFLRRAGRPPQAKPASDIELLVDPTAPAEPRVIGQPLRQAEWRKTPATPTVTPPPVSMPEKRPPRGAGKARKRKSVAEHVAEQVTAHTQSLAEKTAQLGQRIVAEDQQFDVQLKAKFDHTVGTLAGSAVPAAQATPPSDTPAAQIATLLANPGGIRQAVLVNEILRRPSERW
jgi:hypothetical protein